VIVLYDAVDLTQIPGSAHAVAGYVDGLWPTYQELAARFPHAVHRLSIATSAAHDAHCLDVEQGDATPSQVPAWVTRQHARGLPRPILYASLLNGMAAVRGALERAQISHHHYRLWVADWTDVPHCPPGFDGCQWTDRAGGRNCDESLVHDDFFWHPATKPPTVAA
jgi:hypothetical protein